MMLERARTFLELFSIACFLSLFLTPPFGEGSEERKRGCWNRECEFGNWNVLVPSHISYKRTDRWGAVEPLVDHTYVTHSEKILC